MHLDFVDLDKLPILRIPKTSSSFFVLFPLGVVLPEGFLIEVER